MATFTALNGSESRSSEHQSSGPTTKSTVSDDRPATTGQDQQPPSSEVSASQRSHWSGSGPARSPIYQPTTYPDVDGAHKRKRSKSPERGRDAPGLSSEERPRGYPSHSDSRDAHESSSRERDYRPYGSEMRGEGWYASQHRDERGHDQLSADSATSQSEEQLGEALRRSADAQNISPTSPDDDDDSVYYGGPYTPDGQRRDGAVQSDPKKRKRNFSNRTKTGCLTCRKRKKKCDEYKPECNNCLRGGFICQGYPNQRGLQRTETKPVTVPLESKDPTYVPLGAYGMPPPTAWPKHTGTKPHPLPPFRGTPLRIDTPAHPPVLSDEERQTASTASTVQSSTSAFSPESNKLSAINYSAAANVFPTPISAVPSTPNFSDPRGASKEYQRIPPLHDASRTEPETPHPGTGGGLLQLNIPSATQNGSSAEQQPPPTSNAQVAAQLALSHKHFTAANRTHTQKELMLQGSKYQPFDKELVLERERCSAACWRFNNSTNPNNGVSAAERARLFREILHSKEPINLSPTQTSPVSNVGRVGAECVVESPFTCDYGYNITIGHNVFIGRNCTILDPCSVKIGNNTYIGPGVSIYGAYLNTDPKERQGSKSLQQGKPVVIDEDVWIGGSAILLPGVRVHKGATVAAGAIVTKNVPPFTVVAGNPAHVIRGVTS